MKILILNPVHLNCGAAGNNSPSSQLRARAQADRLKNSC